jgi:hypothetical protein
MELVQIALPIQLNAAFFTVLIAAIALAWGIISYWLSKKNALSLERTRFIFDNLRFFETDPLMQLANQIVNGLAPDFTIETFLDVMKSNHETRVNEATRTSVPPEQIRKCMAIDNYLNFLWRISYAHFTLRTVTVDDLDSFGYYYYKISQHAELMRYCVDQGFEEVIDAIQKLKPIWDETEIENDLRMAVIDKLVADNAATEKPPVEIAK